MSKRVEELSAAYTDARLELLRPDIAADNYTRGRKMSLDIFDGNEVESAYEAGYEQAEKDTIEKACQLLYDYNKQMAEIFGAKAVLSCNQFTIDVERFRKTLIMEEE